MVLVANTPYYPSISIPLYFPRYLSLSLYLYTLHSVINLKVRGSKGYLCKDVGSIRV